MLYIFYRYILGLCSFFVICTCLLLITFFSDPSGFAALGRSETFEPVLTLLYIFTILLAILTILFTHPFITDGDETLEMATPISHASIQANIVLLLSMSFLQMSAVDGDVGYFTEQIIEATAFLLKVGVISLLTSVVGFYAIRHRARVLFRRGEDNPAFCLENSFKGL
tara:strand:+ start:161 stop:664 length:504 start_codon:yes stop_codon:yes gene_type:complete